MYDAQDDWIENVRQTHEAAKGKPMIINPRCFLLTLAAAVVLTACSAPTGNAPTPDANASSAKSVAAAPTADTLLALDKQANEAYIRGDGKFFEGFLSDRFVMRNGGARLDKADTVRRISGNKCDVKDGWALTDPQMLKIDNDAYVLSYVSNMEGSCTADGKTEKMPSPVRSATLLVRNGETWQAAFHGENPIVDLTAAPATDQKEAPKKDDNATANANTAAAPAKPTTDAITQALMAAENSAWEAWRMHDAKKIEDLTASDIAFVNIFGTFFANKADTVKNWTSTACEVTSFTLTDGVGTSISPTVAILTLTGTVNGTCSGKDISGQKIYGNSVYVKDGDAWKWVFGFNSPT
ncbi:MAG: nuclear transport factor 2 family protein [Rudaea sp.]